MDGELGVGVARCAWDCRAILWSHISIADRILFLDCLVDQSSSTNFRFQPTIIQPIEFAYTTIHYRCYAIFTWNLHRNHLQRLSPQYPKFYCAMKILVIITFVSVFLINKCEKEEVLPSEPVHEIDASLEMDNGESITRSKIYRGLPAPVDRPWRTVPERMDTCQQRIYETLKPLYPIYEPNYWGYQVFGLDKAFSSAYEQDRWQEKFGEIFNREILCELLPAGECASVDSIFFRQIMGPPTYALDMVNPPRRQYMYVLSFPYRRGPCPYVWATDPNNKYGPMTFEYCAYMRAIFDADGQLTYIMSL